MRESNQPAGLSEFEGMAEQLSRAISDVGAASMAPLVVIGDRLGLYRSLAVMGPLTAAELAAHTGTSRPHVQAWLNAHAASGYLTHSAESGRFGLTEEHAALFAHEDSPAFIVGAFQLAVSGA